MSGMLGRFLTLMSLSGLNTTLSTTLKKSANLSDLTNAVTARTNLGLGGAATHGVGDFDTVGAAAAATASALQKTSNLSDLANAATARINLGLGTAAMHPASDFITVDGPLTSLQIASNLSDLANAATARINLGLGTAATAASASFVASGTAALVANNLSDLANAATARINLGLGGCATLSVGTLAGTVCAGDDTRLNAKPYIISVMLNRAPTASEEVCYHTFPVATTFTSGLANSGGYAKTLGTGATVFDIRKRTAAGANASIGSAQWASGAAAPTFTFSVTVTFSIGDTIIVVAPATPDTTFSKFGLSILGARN